MPRNYTRVSTRATSYTQHDLETAVQKIKDKKLTYIAASRLYGIPTSTLSDRVLNKTAIKSNTLGRPPAIPIQMEYKLANCLRTMEKWGWGLSREEVLDVTEEFVKSNNIDTPFKDGRPGADWFISFRQRHNLSIKKPQPVEYLRKKMTDPFVIHEYFSILEKTLKDLNLKDPNRIWNLDETSVCLDPTKTKIVGAIGAPCTRTTYGSAKENITVLTTVNAAGKKLDPLIVYKGKHMYEEWMAESTDNYDFDISYASSKRGWIETEIFYNYMLKVVVPNLGEERPVLLLYDGHVTHVDDKVVALAVENNITIIKLPAHTSHLLQPLDLAVFKSFKVIWDKKLVTWQRENVGVKIRKQCFAKMFAEAWQDTKPQVIRNGFKKGGIFPYDAAVIPQNKYDPMAYARWQKHIAQTLKQPETLKQLCLNKINDLTMPRNSSASAMTTIANLETTTADTVSFEELLLKKLTQHPQNKIAVKLTRVAKGAEVITKSFTERQKQTELDKAEENKLQKIVKRKRKTVPKSKKENTDDLAKPESSGYGKKITNTVPISTNMIKRDTYISTKGKGKGKKTMIEKERLTSEDNEKFPASNFPNMIELTSNEVEKTTCTAPCILANKTNSDPYISAKVEGKGKGKGKGKKTRINKENLTFQDIKKTLTNKKQEKNTSKKIATKKPAKKLKRSVSIASTYESIEMSLHSDSDINSLSELFPEFEMDWNETDYNLTDHDINFESKKTEPIAREKEIVEEETENDRYKEETNITKNLLSEILPEFEMELHKTDYNLTDHDNKSERKKTELTLRKKEIEEIVEKETGNDSYREEKNINKNKNKVTILSSVKMTPENQTFYRTTKCFQLQPVDIKLDLFTDQNRKKLQNMTDCKQKKKIKKETDLKTYNVGDTILVRYFKQSWKYYVGVIENIKINPKLYTVVFYKSVGKETDVKFVIPKRKDQDNVPDSNIVKEIELLQIKEDPAEFMLLHDEDSIYF